MLTDCRITQTSRTGGGALVGTLALPHSGDAALTRSDLRAIHCRAGARS